MGSSSRVAYLRRTMSMSSAEEWITGFWEYYWVYARTRVGVHTAATAALTLFGLLMYFHRGFVVLAIASYVLPPVYLYHIGDDPESASIERTDEGGDNDTDFDGRDADADGTDADADADADGIDIDTDGDDFDVDYGSDADADADGADADADGADADADGADADADGADVDIDN